MTYYSLKILDYPELPFESADNFKPGGLVQDLDAHARMCGSYGAVAWAKARGLDLHYVDNCWVYITVDTEDLADFFDVILEGKDSPNTAVRSGRRFLLMAEEF